MIDLYADEDLVRRLTQECVEKGDTVFQIHRLAPTEAEHVHELLRFFHPPEGAVVLDYGCGVGAVAQMMKNERPDLDFVLLNPSQAQLDMCPTHFLRIKTMTELKTPVDAVMMQYVLGHLSIAAAMQEIGDALIPGGLFFLYDLVGPEKGRVEEEMDYRVYPPSMLMKEAQENGLKLHDVRTPLKLWTDHFYDKMPEEIFCSVFDKVYPMLYRFIKC